jgi:DNA polymerase V
LMTAMDQINARYGQGTLAIASAGMSRNPHVWAARQDRRTPSFTTDWNELAIAQA